MTRRGFTIVELIITITIMGILLTLAVINVSSTQMNARDDERKADAEALSSSLEAYYGSGPTSTMPSITNLITNPSFETNTTSWILNCNGGSGAVSNEQKYTGSLSLKFTPSTTSGFTGICVSPAPGNNGDQYTFSAYVYSPTTQNINLAADGYGASTYASIGPNWQRMSATGTKINNNALYVRAQNPTGQPFYVDSVMVTKSDTLYPYADGTYYGWGWSGAAHGSTSTGPAIKIGEPGSYPNTSLTTPALLKLFLTDINQKSTLPPGQTNAATSFVTATNAVQTAAGVAPQPTKDQYVYQPIDSNGALCGNYDCRKYNIYYRLENNSTVYRITSKNQ